MKRNFVVCHSIALVVYYQLLFILALICIGFVMDKAALWQLLFLSDHFHSYMHPTNKLYSSVNQDQVQRPQYLGTQFHPIPEIKNK
jgi:hypothetical protein